VLNAGRETSRATPPHVDALYIKRLTRTQEETTSRGKTVSIDRVDAAKGLAQR